MKRMIIVGGGALGNQALSQLLVDYAFGKEWLIGGFLDTRGPDAVTYSPDFPWLGSPLDFVPDENHIFTAAVGDTALREQLVTPLVEKGAEFVSIRTRCQLGYYNDIGPSFLGFDVSTGLNTRIGAYSYIDQGSMIGHDCTIGDFVHIGQRCIIAGYVTIGRGAVVHSGAMIARGCMIGDNAVVGMGAVVFGNVPANTTVIGNPARKFDFK